MTVVTVTLCYGRIPFDQSTYLCKMAAKANKTKYEIRMHGILSSRDVFRAGIDTRTIPRSVHRRAASGDVLIETGSKPTGIFLLLEGRAAFVVRSGRTLSIDVKHSDAIPIFGLLETLAGSTSAARLIATTDCDLVFLSEGDLADLLLHRPEISLKIAAAAGRSFAMALHAIKHH